MTIGKLRRYSLGFMGCVVALMLTFVIMSEFFQGPAWLSITLAAVFGASIAGLLMCHQTMLERAKGVSAPITQLEEHTPLRVLNILPLSSEECILTLGVQHAGDPSHIRIGHVAYAAPEAGWPLAGGWVVRQGNRVVPAVVHKDGRVTLLQTKSASRGRRSAQE